MHARPLDLDLLFSVFKQGLKNKIQHASTDPRATLYVQSLQDAIQYLAQLEAALKAFHAIKQDNLFKAVAEQAFLEYENLIRYLLSREFLFEKGNDYDYEYNAIYSRLPQSYGPYPPYSANCYVHLNNNLKLLLPLAKSLIKVLDNSSDAEALKELSIAATNAIEEVNANDKKIINRSIARTSILLTGIILATVGLVAFSAGILLCNPLLAFIGFSLLFLGAMVGAASCFPGFDVEKNIELSKKSKPVVNRANNLLGLFSKAVIPEKNEINFIFKATV